jgi:hypothetical protein
VITTDHIQCGIGGDAIKPISEGTLGFVTVKVLPRAQEGLLGHILCKLNISTHPIHHGDHSNAMEANQFAKGTPVPTLGLGD